MTLTPKDRLSIVTLALGAFLGTVAMYSVNIAIPLITEDFHATLGVVSWVLNGFILIVAAFCIIIGRLADIRGLKRTFLEGLLLFIGASLLCFFAPDILILIAARILQAFGASMFIAASPALVAASIPESDRGVGLSWVTGASTFGAAAGIGLGGIISGIFGWRSLFLFMILTATAAYLLGRTCISPVEPLLRTEPFDIRGSVLLFCAMTTLLAGFSLDYLPAVSDTVSAVLYGSSLVFAAAFIANARRTKNPVLNIGLFRNRDFSFALLSLMVMYLVFGGVTFFLPFILMNGLHISVVTAGLIMTAAAVLSIIISPVSGFLSDRFGSRPVCIASVLFVLCILIGFTQVTREYAIIVILLVIFSRVGLAIYSPPSAKLILDHTPAGHEGSAAGIMQTGRNSSYTIGVAVFCMVFEAAVYSAGLPADGNAVIPRLTAELMRTGFLATFTAAALFTLPALLFSFLARDRKTKKEDREMSPEELPRDMGF
jgi:MFS family permease